jgi:cytochrome c
MLPKSFSFLALMAASTAHAQAAGGDQMFKQRCQICHTATPGVLAPSLKGVVGRKAGTAAKFNYSPALKTSKIVWTNEKLDKFLTAPGQMVPGTRMVVNISDPAQRAAIIAHLATQK